MATRQPIRGNSQMILYLEMLRTTLNQNELFQKEAAVVHDASCPLNSNPNATYQMMDVSYSASPIQIYIALKIII